LSQEPPVTSGEHGSDLLTAALDAARRNWAVLPVHSLTRNGVCTCGRPGCDKSRAKHPVSKLVPRGVLDATTDEPAIRQWWSTCPWANIGLATGKPSGVDVLDIDPRHGGDENLAALELENSPLPDTVEAISGGRGRHIYFRHTEGISTTTLEPGVELRSTGSYVILPPSKHASGSLYVWESSSSPWRTAMAPPPAWLLERAKVRTSGARPAALPPPLHIDPSELRIPERVRSLITSGWRENCGYPSRSEADFAVVGALLRAGHDAATIRGIFEEQPIGAKYREKKDGARYLSLTIARAQAWTPSQGRLRRPEKPDNASVRTESRAAQAPATPSRSFGFRHTDYGNAERLVARHGADMHFCRPWASWYVWDGRRFVRDRTGVAERLAKETVRAIYGEVTGIADDDDRRATARWAIASETAGRIRAMLELAASELGVPVVPEQLDANPWVLNCLNGTVDLRTGKLGPHRREDLITKLCPVPYHPCARLPLWEEFLERSTAGDHELQSFLQRAAGYSLTGDYSEEVLFFIHGPQAAGKSTFIEAMKAHLGDFASTADFETFLTRRDVGGPRNDLARLAGTRFVSSIEVEDGKRLAEGLIKMITGGDTLTARFLYREAFEFAPTFKLWLAANHAPRVRHDDDAVWRRILRIPFEHTIPRAQRDPKVKIQLRDRERAGPAILAWAVRGCLEWQAHGLGIPAAVQLATDAYRADMDPLKDFLMDRCELLPRARVRSDELWKAYEQWAQDNGDRPIGRRAFGELLKGRGLVPTTSYMAGTTRRVWEGIGLREEEPTD
jgi:putative DNA primase/helicase